MVFRLHCSYRSLRISSHSHSSILISNEAIPMYDEHYKRNLVVYALKLSWSQNQSKVVLLVCVYCSRLLGVETKAGFTMPTVAARRVMNSRPDYPRSLCDARDTTLCPPRPHHTGWCTDKLNSDTPTALLLNMNLPRKITANITRMSTWFLESILKRTRFYVLYFSYWFEWYNSMKEQNYHCNN